MSSHAAVELFDPKLDRRECSVCGRPVVGAGPNLRHEGELFRPATPIRTDVPAYMLAVERARAALTHLPPGADAEAQARAVVDALYRTNMLRRRPGAASRPAAA